MLFEYVDKLEDISTQLDKAGSLSALLNDYFSRRNPHAGELLLRYSLYSDLTSVIDGIVREQTKRIMEAGEELFDFHNKLLERQGTPQEARMLE